MKRHKTKCKVCCNICNKKVAPLEYAEHKKLHEFNLRNSYSVPSIPSNSLELIISIQSTGTRETTKQSETRVIVKKDHISMTIYQFHAQFSGFKI